MNERKVKLMTKLAMYESNEGKEELKIAEYYRKDYQAMHRFLTFIWVTIGYVLIAALVFLFQGPDMLKSLQDVSLQFFVKVGIVFGIGYLVLLITYLIISSLVSGSRHDRAHDGAREYYNGLTKLLKIDQPGKPGRKKRRR